MGNVLYAVDGSVPACEAAGLAHRLLPREAEVLVLEVVPQLPYAWTAWPAFPDTVTDLGRAWAYVGELCATLEAYGRRARTKVEVSPLSAGEMDREILRQAETLRPDLLCLALEREDVVSGILRGAAGPVLVAKCAAPEEQPARRGRAEDRRLEPSLWNLPLLCHPMGALVLRRAGIL